MRINYTAEAIPYELDKDRSRCYMAPNGLREAHLKPGQHVKVGANARETVLKIVPKFDGDENALYLPYEELEHLKLRPGDLLTVQKTLLDYPVAEEVVVSFKKIRKTVERLEALRLLLTDKKIIANGEVVLGGTVRLKEKERIKVTEETKIKIESEDSASPAVGLEKEVEEVKKFIDNAHAPGECKEGESILLNKWKMSSGLIVAGESGMGKKTLCLYVLQEIGKEWVRVHGNRAKLMEDAFEYAKLNEPCTIWIDRLDRFLEDKQVETVICAERILEEIKRERRRIAVIATVTEISQVPKELKGAYLLDRAVCLHAPTVQQRRKQIGLGLAEHSKIAGCVVDSGVLERAAKRTAGFTRGEIHLLIRDAVFAQSLVEEKAKITEVPLEESIKNLSVGMDMRRRCSGECGARLLSKIVRSVPSASEGAPVEVPDIRFTAIFGQEQAKEKLKEAVIWPIIHRELFEEVGVRPPKGVLLYGPPGCGKTLIAQALANESGAVFLSIRGPEIMGKYVGESEERLRKVFARARAQIPSIIFIDEIDSIAPHRESEGGQVDKRVVSTLLMEMDGVGSESGVFVLGATNKPWSIDSALMRPGRFDCHVLVDLPEKETRKEIIKSKVGQTLKAVQKWESVQEIDIASLEEYFAERTEGFTGAELAGLCTDLSMGAVRFRIEKLCSKTENADIVERLKEIAKKTKPRISQKEVNTFRAFSKDQMDM